MIMATAMPPGGTPLGSFDSDFDTLVAEAILAVEDEVGVAAML